MGQQPKQDEGMFHWSDDLSVGLPEIDVQHYTFIGFINDAHHSLTVPGAIGEIREVLDNLVSYAQVHFAYEENLFEKYAYPEAEAHIKEHRDFMSRVKEQLRDFDTGGGSVNLSVCVFMKNWLAKHIAVSDQRYAKYFQENNIVLD